MITEQELNEIVHEYWCKDETVMRLVQEIRRLRAACDECPLALHYGCPEKEQKS